MRVPLVQYALIPLLTLALVGCQTSPPKIKVPKVSMSKLNPFSKRADNAEHPPKPSDLAAPGGRSPAGAGYADASSPAPDYQQFSQPAASAGSLADSAGSMNPATMPQSGYYGTNWGYERAGQSGTSPSYQASAGPSAAIPVYDGAGTSQSGVATSPRYGVVADRYGLDRSAASSSADASFSQASSATSPSMPSHAYPPLGSQAAALPYERAGSPEYAPKSDTRYGVGSSDSGLSVADKRRDSGPSYGADTSALVGDRYTSRDGQAAAFDSYRNGQLSNSAAGREWNPGETGYEPGQSDYRPGDTGYYPPSTRSYSAPAGSFSSEPFLPGSTKTYTPRTTSGPTAPEGSLSHPQSQPTIDSQVIPAGHPPASRTRLF